MRILSPLILILFLAGCTTLGSLTDRFPYMNQLVGRHISDVLDRLDGVTVASEERLFGGKEYFLFETNEYNHTVNTYNYYGALIDQQHIYNRGSIRLLTDSNGYITRYMERGYIPVEGSDFDHTLRSALRDILVFDQ